MTKIIKKILFAVVISSSMLIVSGLSTSVMAAEDAGGVRKGIMDTMAHIMKGIKAADGKDQEATMTHINGARQTSKEITGDTFGAKLQIGSDTVLQAKRAAKSGDLEGASKALNDALAVYKKMEEIAL